MEIFDFILKGLIAGILAGYLILYGLRPAVQYPEIILEIFDNKWMFLILLILNYYAFIWDYNIGALLLLCVITLMFDYIVFVENGFNNNDVYDIKQFENFINKAPIFVPDNSTKLRDNIYDNMINDMNSLEFIPGTPAPFVKLDI